MDARVREICLRQCQEDLARERARRFELEAELEAARLLQSMGPPGGAETVDRRVAASAYDAARAYALKQVAHYIHALTRGDAMLLKADVAEACKGIHEFARKCTDRILGELANAIRERDRALERLRAATGTGPSAPSNAARKWTCIGGGIVSNLPSDTNYPDENNVASYGGHLVAESMRDDVARMICDLVNAKAGPVWMSHQWTRVAHRVANDGAAVCNAPGPAIGDWHTSPGKPACDRCKVLP